MPEWRAKYWYDLDTEIGNRILFECNFTAAEKEQIEGMDQLSLPYI
jgi:hypothetical protein